MPLYRFQQVIATQDNVAANFASNTYHFIADDDLALPAIATAVQGVYTAMRLQMSNLTRQNGHEYKIYDTADPEPRAPILEGSWNFSAAIVNNPMPPEVAICLSFQGSKISGQPQSRRRGRVYLPFIQLSGGGADGRPTAGVVTAAVNAGASLLAASVAATTWSWVVASSYTPADGAIVQNGWVDNEWDTQRRRGRVSTARTTF